MKVVKSIENMLILSVLTTVLAVVFVLLFLNTISEFYSKVFIMFIFLGLTTISLIVVNIKKLKVLISSLFFIFLLYGILAITFRSIRDFFPKTSDADNITSFVQYFKYPLYFDTILYFVLIFIPIVTYLLLRNKKLW